MTRICQDLRGSKRFPRYLSRFSSTYYAYHILPAAISFRVDQKYAPIPIEIDTTLRVLFTSSCNFTGPEGYDSTKLAMDYHAVGWGECAAEVGRYLVTMEGLDERDPLRLRLLSHLQSFHRDHPPSAVPSSVPPVTSLTSSSTSSSYEPAASSVPPGMPPGTGTMPPLLGGSALGWGQYPGQYPQQQHGKPYRPWGAELAY